MNFEQTHGHYLLPNGRVIPNASSIWDSANTLHQNVVEWQGKLWVFYIGQNKLTSRGGGAGQIGAFTIDTKQGDAFDGFKYTKVNSGNPLITFNIATVPSPFNVADIEGASMRNLVVCPFNGELWLYFVTKPPTVVSVDDPTEPTDPDSDGEGIADEEELTPRVRGIMKSSDGLTWTWVQELQWGGGPWLDSMGQPWVVGNRMYSLVGRKITGRQTARRLRSTLDGVNWVDHGNATNLPADPLSYEAYGQIMTRSWTEGDYSYALIPGSSWHYDWPEAIGLYRLPNAQLGTQNAIWERYTRNPVFQRSAQEGAVWQLIPFRVGDTWWGIYNTWAPRPGYEANVNSAWMNILRGTPYYRPVNWTFKHIGIAKMANRLYAEDWSREPLTEATKFLIRQGGRYLACVTATTDSDLTWLDDPTDVRCHWRFQKNSDYWLIVVDSAPTLAIRPRGTLEDGVDEKEPDNLRALDQTHRLGPWASTLNGSPVTAFWRQCFHWMISIRGTEPTQAMFANRYTSLSIDNNLRANPAHWGDARFTFDLLPLFPGVAP